MTMEIIPGPNLVVPTATAGDSSNKPASTQFVVQLISSAIASAIASLPVGISTTQVDFLAGGISVPSNQEYRIVEFAPFAITLTKFVGKCSTGTMTAYLSIAGATVTGGTINVGTSQVSSAPSALNTAALGSTLSMFISSVTSALNFSFMVQFNRALAT